MSLKCHTLAPKSDHTHTIILLHGRGGNGRDFLNALMECRKGSLPDVFPGMRWVFPNAKRTCSARFSEDMKQWFDSLPQDVLSEEQHDAQRRELEDSVKLVKWVIEDEAAAVGADNVFVGGVSQGCATAIHALFAHGKRMAGFIGLFGWIALRDDLKAMYGLPNESLRTPAIIEHCEDDWVIKPKYGEELRDTLLDLGMTVEWHLYEEGGHDLHDPVVEDASSGHGIEDMVVFLQKGMVKPVEE